jgi:hypothetical protein
LVIYFNTYLIIYSKVVDSLNKSTGKKIIV